MHENKLISLLIIDEQDKVTEGFIIFIYLRNIIFILKPKIDKELSAKQKEQYI